MPRILNSHKSRLDANHVIKRLSLNERHHVIARSMDCRNRASDLFKIFVAGERIYIFQQFLGQFRIPVFDQRTTGKVWRLQQNGLDLASARQFKSDSGSKRIADATLVAMTLMIAESRPEDMEMMVKVVVNLMR